MNDGDSILKNLLESLGDEPDIINLAGDLSNQTKLMIGIEQDSTIKSQELEISSLKLEIENLKRMLQTFEEKEKQSSFLILLRALIRDFQDDPEAIKFIERIVNLHDPMEQVDQVCEFVFSHTNANNDVIQRILSQLQGHVKLLTLLVNSKKPDEIIPQMENYITENSSKSGIVFPPELQSKILEEIAQTNDLLESIKSENSENSEFPIPNVFESLGTTDSPEIPLEKIKAFLENSYIMPDELKNLLLQECAVSSILKQQLQKARNDLKELSLLQNSRKKSPETSPNSTNNEKNLSKQLSDALRDNSNLRNKIEELEQQLCDQNEWKEKEREKLRKELEKEFNAKLSFHDEEELRDDAIDELKEELRPFVKNELKRELRKEVKDELYNDSHLIEAAKHELMNDNHFKDQIIEELKQDHRIQDEAKNAIIDDLQKNKSFIQDIEKQIRSKVENGLKEELKGQFEKKFKRELMNSLKDKVEEELRNELIDVVRDNLKKDKSIREAAKSELKQDLKRNKSMINSIREQLENELRNDPDFQEELKDKMKSPVIAELKRELKPSVIVYLKKALAPIIKNQLQDQMKEQLMEEIQEQNRYTDLSEDVIEILKEASGNLTNLDDMIRIISQIIIQLRQALGLNNEENQFIVSKVIESLEQYHQLNQANTQMRALLIRQAKRISDLESHRKPINV